MLKKLFDRYKHAWVLLYALIYFPWYSYLENRDLPYNGYYVMSTVLDKKIPFVEQFIVFYLLWFAFMAVFFVYFFFTDKTAFYKLTALAYAGFTIYLVISTFFPNGQHLRPMFFQRENVFIDLVRMIYKSDTPTNVFPSMHVFGTLAICIAIDQSDRLRQKRIVKNISYFLATMIILSTLFLKQHSIVDVIGAIVLAYGLYQLVYLPEKKPAVRSVQAAHHI